MGTTLVIAEAETIVVYAMENGLFDEVMRLTFKKKPNHSTIVQYVTAVSQVVNNGKPVPEAAKKILEKAGPVEKKSKKVKKKPAHESPVRDQVLLFKSLAGFDEWRTVKEAHELVDKYSSVDRMYANVRRAYTEGYLERRMETDEERTVREIRGRSPHYYRMNAKGRAKLNMLRLEAQKTN
jgi:hypothetical protein